MNGPTSNNNWPSARHFTEALQCPAVCFTSQFLRDTLPAVDKLGMPLVTSGQFAYVYKLNRPDGGAWGVRCFRAYLPDRQARYAAFDAHFRQHQFTALPRFAYEPQGLRVNGQFYPVLIMEWLAAPTLDNYIEKVLDRPDVLRHLAGEWARLTTQLRGMGVAHGDLQQGNILVQNGAFRLVDLDGMFVPALRGWKACEVGHQHFQHPRRDESWFDADLDNFSALSIYLSLITLAERPTLWREHHDENLLFTRADFQKPDASPLFRSIRELGEEHQRLADTLIAACRRARPNVPPLAQLVEVPEESNLPAWMKAPAGIEVATRTREAQRAPAPVARPAEPGRAPTAPPTYAGQAVYVRPNAVNPNVTTLPSGVQTLFNGPAHVQAAATPIFNPAALWNNTFSVAWQAVKSTFSKVGAFWIIFLFSSVWIRLITAFWGMFDVTAGPAFVLTFLLIASGYLLYGFIKALDMWSQSATALTASGWPSNAVISNPASNIAPPPALNAPPQAALPPATPSNIPWYRPQPNAPQMAPKPLSPGARRAPDWAIRNAPPSTAPPQTVPHAQVTPPSAPPSATIPASLLPLAANSAPASGTTPPASPNAATPPPIVGNRDTRIYHQPDCEEAVIISADDEVAFVSPTAAELQGFRRCPICKPASPKLPLTAPLALEVVANTETGVYHRKDCTWAAMLAPQIVRRFISPSAAEHAGFHRCSHCQPHKSLSANALPSTLPQSAPAPTRQLFIIGDKRHKIFHRWDCAVLRGSPATELVEFVTPFVAYGNGYVRCPQCRP